MRIILKYNKKLDYKLIITNAYLRRDSFRFKPSKNDYIIKPLSPKDKLSSFDKVCDNYMENMDNHQKVIHHRKIIIKQNLLYEGFKYIIMNFKELFYEDNI